MEYEFDTDPARIPRDAVWAWLSTEAYWGRTRSRADVDAQLDSAWRVVGVYHPETGRLVGFARAVSDGVTFAYLADVFVVDGHRGQGVGSRIVRTMIDEGPGAHFRWVLFTRDAHEVYRRFGFAEPDETAMVRPASSS
ncbi:GNAT family N-acetyltransferase [Microbacterium trichothecenolyticum]|uniref:GNAT superfamily N-acetyltransferase n=1 Tax=Microbacterium trichothecenolyticum TaxID=69370 RepID=A0ABU0TSM6_MICTR|nr:GNAT family N-acetyltransferase [Microbacterium trichothecenolyticum]MDQ1122653.1 GNAT superfamily N-acetyltransferase [Microbacterium trichothecenolyticum]